MTTFIAQVKPRGDGLCIPIPPAVRKAGLKEGTFLKLTLQEMVLVPAKTQKEEERSPHSRTSPRDLLRGEMQVIPDPQFGTGVAD